MRELLRDRTIITFAHRLDTIADCDRVLAVESGRAVEWDMPVSLLKTGGFFAHLVEETGPVEKAKLVQEKKAERSDAAIFEVREFGRILTRPCVSQKLYSARKRKLRGESGYR